MANHAIISLLVKSKVSDPAGLAKEKKEDGSLSASKLLNVKRFALRRGVWFKALSRIDRAVVDLTIRYVDNIKSSKLVQVLTDIVQKLEQATESMADRLTRSIGVPLAKKASSIALSWGNFSAKHWTSDLSFAAFLAVMQTNR